MYRKSTLVNRSEIAVRHGCVCVVGEGGGGCNQSAPRMTFLSPHLSLSISADGGENFLHLLQGLDSIVFHGKAAHGVEM